MVHLFLKPSEIYYSQDSISNTFDSKSRHGQIFIGETLDDLCDDLLSVSDIQALRVCWLDDKWVTADNRRLWVFRHLERLRKCSEIPVHEVYFIPADKLTSTNGGVKVRVRGKPGGVWYKEQTPKKPRSRPNQGITLPQRITHDVYPHVNTKAFYNNKSATVTQTKGSNFNISMSNYNSSDTWQSRTTSSNPQPASFQINSPQRNTVTVHQPFSTNQDSTPAVNFIETHCSTAISTTQERGDEEEESSGFWSLLCCCFGGKKRNRKIK